MAIVASTRAGAGGGGSRIRLSSTLLLGILLAVISTLGLLTRSVVIIGDAHSHSGGASSLRTAPAHAAKTTAAKATATTTNAHQQVADEKDQTKGVKREEIHAKREKITGGETNTDATKRKSFPKPSDLAGPNAQVILQPTHGKHNPASDAVFAFAEGYQLHTYVGFVESLKATNYEGDVVLSVSHRSKLSTGVEDYLSANHGNVNLIYYAIDWTCWKKNGDRISNTNGGMSDCQARGLYGDEHGTALKDPREARPVATARYELYWIWSLQYEPYRRILLIDVRDTYFQRGPFDDLPVTQEDDNGNSANDDGGVLRLYEENASPSSAAASIGKSSYNSQWISAAYGKQVLDQMRDKPVICSGSTIGDALAIEAYLRAMVAQFDSTRCKKKGCDQGMHQVLYYGNHLNGVQDIREIIVSKQGEGEVNNLAAMRNSPLSEQGVLVNGNIVNWGDRSISAVVHQYDRDKETSKIIKERINKWVKAVKK